MRSSVRSVRAIRALRLLRILRAGTAAAVAVRDLRGLLNHRGLAYVLCVGMIAVTLGALGIYLLEQGETIHSLADAYWWAIVTVTTVGYGDVSPKTGEGRLIAVALMFVGIGVISVFTATLASFSFRPMSSQKRLVSSGAFRRSKPSSIDFSRIVNDICSTLWSVPERSSHF